MKNLVVILSLLLAILVLAFLLLSGPFSGWTSKDQSNDQNTEIDLSTILSFEACEAAGFPVMESYPRQCSLPDGRVYAEEVVAEAIYENASADLIRVENPHAGGVVGKEFVVTGAARGQWFFEASFPIEVLSEEGNVIAGSFATAEGDWMTTDFVSFKSEIIDLPSAYVGPAWLVLKKSNASGLPEHDASIWIPIEVAY